MEQLNVLMKCIGCAGVTLVGMILIPLGVLICIDDENDMSFLWVAVWIFVTAYVYNTIFG